MKTILLLLSLMTLNTYAQHAGNATDKDLEGVVAAYRCSGAFVALGQAHYNSGIVLSAGHCSADEPEFMYAPGEARVNFRITDKDEYGMFYKYSKKYQTRIMESFKLSTILYATMTKEDVTLFQSFDSTRSLQVKGIRSFKLAKKLPKVGQILQVTSAYWQQTQVCTVEKIIKNNTEELELLGKDPGVPQKNTILLSENCTAKGGWSGSPLYDPKTREVYGVASRIVEARPGSKLYKEGAKARLLVSSVEKLSHCLTSSGKLDLKNSECQLIKK